MELVVKNPPFELSTDDIKSKDEKYDLHVFLNFNTFDIVVVDPWSIFYFDFFIKPETCCYKMQMIYDRKSEEVIMGQSDNDYTKLEWVEMKKTSFPYQFSIKKIEEYLIGLNQIYFK
jgi:hypothetical protein